MLNSISLTTRIRTSTSCSKTILLVDLLSSLTAITKQETFVRNNLNKPCEQIVGYDANALYLWAIGQPMPSGYPLIHREQNFFVREFPEFAGECRDWIDWIAHEHNIKIQSAFHGGEKRIGRYKVDGYCQEQNKVFEFHGDYWHAHPSMFPDENALHPSIKHKDQTPKTIKVVREYDREKVKTIQWKSSGNINGEHWLIFGQR